MRKIVKFLLFVSAFILLTQVSLKPTSAQEAEANAARVTEGPIYRTIQYCVGSSSKETIQSIYEFRIICRGSTSSLPIEGPFVTVEKWGKHFVQNKNCHTSGRDLVPFFGHESYAWSVNPDPDDEDIGFDGNNYYRCFDIPVTSPEMGYVEIKTKDKDGNEIAPRRDVDLEPGDYSFLDYLKKSACANLPLGGAADDILCGDTKTAPNICDAGGGVTGIDTAIGCIPIGDENGADFIGFLLKWALGIGGGIAFLMMIYAGFIIMTSTGNPERLQSGRQLLVAAISGLLLLIFALFLLRLIGVRILQIPGF